MQNSDSARILIVDDQIHALHGVARIMRGAGYETFEASTGTDCLKLAAQHKPDLILLDIVMPAMDGFDTLKKIKADKRFQKIKVIIFTNLDNDEDKKQAFEMGADDYFVKARYTPSELAGKVNIILSSNDAA